MRKVMHIGPAAAAAAAVLFMAVPAEAQVMAAPGEAIRTLISGGSRVGAAVRDVTADDVAAAGLAEARGVVIETVDDGGPAAEAGLAPGDLVVEFDAERVRSVRQFQRLVEETPAGRAVGVAIQRDGTRQVLTITPESTREAAWLGLRRLPRALDDFDVDVAVPGLFAGSRTRLGVGLTPLGDQLAGFFGVEAGVLVSSVEEGSAAASAGLRAGDVITAVNGDEVDSVVDVRAALAGAGEGATVTLDVVRDGQPRTLTATLPVGA